MNLHSKVTPGAEYPAESSFRRQHLLIASATDAVVQEALTSPENLIGGFGPRLPSGSHTPVAAAESRSGTAAHAPTRQGTAAESLAPRSNQVVDHCLQAIISLDVPRDTVHVDIDGCLTRITRTSLLEVTERIRKFRFSSHIRVHLGSAAFVESTALAGLRMDLETEVGRASGRPGQGRVSLETCALESATSRHALSGITLRAARLDDFTKVDLLAASDFLFAWLDDAHGCSGTDVSAMLALYEHIGQEISGRTSTRQT